MTKLVKLPKEEGMELVISFEVRDKVTGLVKSLKEEGMKLVIWFEARDKVTK